MLESTHVVAIPITWQIQHKNQLQAHIYCPQPTRRPQASSMDIHKAKMKNMTCCRFHCFMKLYLSFCCRFSIIYHLSRRIIGKRARVLCLLLMVTEVKNLNEPLPNLIAMGMGVLRRCCWALSRHRSSSSIKYQA